MQQTGQLFIGGAWVPPDRGRMFPVVDPSTAETLGEAADAGTMDVESAVAAATASMEGRHWLGMDPLERARILQGIAREIRDRQTELARWISAENGMPINFAQWLEIPMAADAFDYFAGLVAQVRGDTLPMSVPGPQGEYLVMTLKEPVGVAALITPWNFPLLLPAWKLAPALAAGCSVILKPAPQTPFTAVALGEICAAAGVPAGVVNILTGGDATGAALVDHGGIPKIAFTGESATGSRVLAAAAPHIKRVTLELGGKSPNIIFDDVDLDDAVSGALFGVYLNSGQVCQAGTRILVQESIHDQFVDRMVERVADLHVGPGSDPLTDVGPVISSQQLQRVLAYIDAGVAAGARLVAGGNRLDNLGNGFFVAPTILTDVAPEMQIAREEVFGPVAAVLPFRDEAHAIALANDSLYGLAAGVWTRDVKRALRVVRAVKAGTVWVNTYQILSATVPFGGYKRSGLGRELGPQALEPYLETKTVMMDMNEEPLSYF